MLTSTAARNDRRRPPLSPVTAPPSPVAAQVWRRARELVDPLAHHDVVALALDLLRTAHHDPATLADALALGRLHVGVHPDDTAARGGVKVLERAIAFLGMKPTGSGDADAGTELRHP